MDQDLTGKRPSFGRSRSNFNPYRLLLWVALIAFGIWVVSQIDSGEGGRIKPLFLPTPTATRTADSYLMEAQAHFEAGRVDDTASTDAIDAYRQALEMDPDNAHAWAELARILTYSSSLLSSQGERIARMEEARQAADQAVELNPDDSTVQAMRALVLDWSASVALDDTQRRAWLVEAEQVAGFAYNLDPSNYLALAFYAEVLLDQQKWSQAEQYAKQAVELAPEVMDTHRVYATVLETFGQYRVAIEEYNAAVRINPNLTFLYIRIGVIYRELQQFELALEYFERAITINNSNGVQDPLPYIAIAKTYARMGEFFAAALNAEKALSFDPTNANTYGQLGDIYTRARNYESALPVLKCAVQGCTADENEVGEADVQSLPLTNVEVAYYYARYGSVLAALSRPTANYCSEALDVLERVREEYAADPVLMGIVSENEAICRLVDETPESEADQAP
ncbi:MAG: tetratricopeptide repeat protein [Anaerolineales bacterium]|jgi:tetratricopeptide (TPR) repeat protein